MTRQEVKDALAAVGGTNVRIVGSVGSGQDEAGWDLDLIVEFPPEADIVTLLTLEDDLRALLTVPVDVISARSSGNPRESTLEESVPCDRIELRGGWATSHDSGRKLPTSSTKADPLTSPTRWNEPYDATRASVS